MVMKLDQLVNGAINVGFGAAAVAVEMCIRDSGEVESPRVAAYAVAVESKST